MQEPFQNKSIAELLCIPQRVFIEIVQIRKLTEQCRSMEEKGDKRTLSNELKTSTNSTNKSLKKALKL